MYVDSAPSTPAMPTRIQPCKRSSLIGLVRPPGRSGENTRASDSHGNETPATWWASSSARLASGTELDGGAGERARGDRREGLVRTGGEVEVAGAEDPRPRHHLVAVAGELAPADLAVAVVERAGQVEVGLDRDDADRRLHPVARLALAHGVDRKLRPPVPELAAHDLAVPDVHRAVVERERLPERVDGSEGDWLRQVEAAEEPGADDDGVAVGVVATQVAGVARVRHVLLARRGARAERQPAPRRGPGCGAGRRAQVEHVARAFDDHAGVAEEPGAVGLVGCVDVEVARRATW